MLNILRNTVFHPIAVDWKADKVLAVLFHRSAATLYLIYFFWAAASLWASYPILMVEDGDVIEELLSLLILPTAASAFIGALYFPKFARLEMFSAGSFVTLVLFYEIYVVLGFFQGDMGKGVSFVLNLSHLVIPVVRIVFIYLTLIKQANDKKDIGGIRGDNAY